MHARYNKTNNTDMLMSVSQSQFYPRGIHFISSDQGSNPGSLHWEQGVLATGPPGKSLGLTSFAQSYFFCSPLATQTLSQLLLLENSVHNRKTLGSLQVSGVRLLKVCQHQYVESFLYCPQRLLHSWERPHGEIQNEWEVHAFLRQSEWGVEEGDGLTPSQPFFTQCRLWASEVDSFKTFPVCVPPGKSLDSHSDSKLLPIASCLS